MSLFRHPFFIGLVSAVVATLITLRVTANDEAQVLVPEGYDEACRQAEYEMAVGYDNQFNWVTRVLCGDHEKGLGLVTINGYGAITENVRLYGVDEMPVHGNYETPVTFITTRFGGPSNTTIREEVSGRVPEGCEVVGYTEAYFYSEPGWSGAIMTNAKPLVTCNGDARIIGTRGNEQTLVRDFQWL